MSSQEAYRALTACEAAFKETQKFIIRQNRDVIDIGRMMRLVSFVTEELRKVEAEQLAEDEERQRRDSLERTFLDKCGVQVDELDYQKVFEVLTSEDSPKLGLKHYKNLKQCNAPNGVGGNAFVCKMMDCDSTSAPSSKLLSAKIFTVNEHVAPDHPKSPVRHRKRILREAKYWHMALQGNGRGKDRIAPLEGVYLCPVSNKFGVPSLVSLWRDDGNLYQYVRATWGKQSDDSERRRLAAEVLEGLAYLHELEVQIVHGDLKSENVLVYRDQNNVTHAQLIDFGSARRTEGHTGLTSTTNPTTELFQAPEIVYPGSTLTVWSDMFAYGYVLLEIIYKVNVQTTFHDVDSKFKNLPKIPGISKDDVALVTRLWCDIPQGRPNALTALSLLQC
ncbi:kinase-like protein [Schizopora paradoxa]|uniref:Kinase-like protein n=1 Tax=Schizopora paradoxa TaxID=27342 RepID=A0A0H2RWP6_9AGAM|nr:kinase-like protein [Schizopora paradoxa]